MDVSQYVKSCELTMQNSSAASHRNKYYDKKTQDRKFSGSEVLVLLPSASNKLLSSWLGPFLITKVFHPNYRVLVKGKEKVFHANILKRYVRREEAADVAVGGSKCVQFFVCLFVVVFLRSPAISLGFTTLGEIFAYVTVF